MKHQILNEIKNQIKAKPQLKKKLKILALVSFVFLFIVSGLVIWAGASAIRYASQYVQDINIGSTGAITTQRCLDQAYGLIQFEPWLTKPASENFQNLKTACLDKNSETVCQSESCKELNI